MIFDVLFLIYAKKNKKQNVRNKFKTLIMRINQRFSKFFSKFLLLFNQLLHYSKQNSTLSIKKCSIYSFDANDRSKRILINTKILFLKVDKFNQYLIQVFNQSIRQNHLKCVSIVAIVTHIAFKSTITYNFQLIDQSCKTK